jgi:putative PEP-CTERM system histidine kinase
MGLYSLLAFATAVGCSSLAVYVYLREERSLPNLTLAAAMAMLAVSEVFSGFASRAHLPSHVLFWTKLGFLPQAVTSGLWLVFSLSFARSNHQELLRRWKLPVTAAFLVPLLLVAFVHDQLLQLPKADAPVDWIFPLVWAGKVFHSALIVVSVAVLANLEATLRATVGSKRWRIKYMLIGVGGYCAARIYVSSQALLYSALDPFLGPVTSIAAIMACAMAAVSLARTRETIVRIHVSRSFAYNSAAVFLVGVYLIAVGALAELLRFLGGAITPLVTIAIFLALVLLAAFLLSGQIREGIKRFIVRNFYSHGYDYRKEWNRFARLSTPVLDPQELCSAVSRLVSETFGADSVTIWRIDEPGGHVLLGGSTVLSPTQPRTDPGIGRDAERLVLYVGKREEIVDFEDPPDREGEEIAREISEFLRITQTRFAIPLSAAHMLVGAMALNARVTGEPFTLEDTDLLRTIADQTAASLLNLHFSAKVTQAKEMEAFQTLSSFFVHDLKNLASMLSLTVQNLPQNYVNPAFRQDALRIISDSVEKMNTMCSRLSTLKTKLDLDRQTTDLNALARDMVARLNGLLQASVSVELGRLPAIYVDREQIDKVLTNLVLNANEAIENGGCIRLSTEERGGWAILTVADTGHGMSEEFVAQRLFRPFHTTKSKGLGIGLFQTKRLVEAHGGRIEVESVEGRGSTFRVFLPPAGASRERADRDREAEAPGRRRRRSDPHPDEMGVLVRLRSPARRGSRHGRGSGPQ